MNKIRIINSNREAIDQAIKEVQGDLCRVNLLSVENILEVADQAEKQLEDLRIPIKNRSGAEFYYCPAGPWAKSFQFGQGATDVRLIRKSSGWFVKIIERTKVFPLAKVSNVLYLKIEQKEIAVTKFCGNFKTLPLPVEEYACVEGIS